MLEDTIFITFFQKKERNSFLIYILFIFYLTKYEERWKTLFELFTITVITLIVFL